MSMQLTRANAVIPTVSSSMGEVYAFPVKLKRKRKYCPPPLPEDLVEELIQQMDANAAALPIRATVVAEDLFDPLLWECLSKQLHPSVGKQVAYRVAMGHLPLRADGKTDENHNQYVRI